ncbi:hypothetical protein L1049_021833 [Liquidambar formosana]|uniref:RNase H type-1 domain-containing protein n=1 Tax=Liquidambar formosana TaxID=63359 RepID=A0AAP0WNF9_LIQFO
MGRRFSDKINMETESSIQDKALCVEGMYQYSPDEKQSLKTESASNDAVRGEEKMAMVLKIMWAIWHSRNLVMFEAMRNDPQSTAYTALRYLDEYITAQSRARKGVNAISARWLSLVPGRFKINANGAQFAEVSAITFRFAIEFAIDLGLTAIDFEGDNLEVMATLYSDSVPHTAMGLILDDVLTKAAASFVLCHFMHIGREGNEVAHGLAKYAKFVKDVIIWMEETPSRVQDQVNCDLSHLSS